MGSRLAFRQRYHDVGFNDHLMAPALLLGSVFQLHGPPILRQSTVDLDAGALLQLGKGSGHLSEGDDIDPVGMLLLAGAVADGEAVLGHEGLFRFPFSSPVCGGRSDIIQSGEGEI